MLAVFAGFGAELVAFFSGRMSFSFFAGERRFILGKSSLSAYIFFVIFVSWLLIRPHPPPPFFPLPFFPAARFAVNFFCLTSTTQTEPCLSFLFHDPPVCRLNLGKLPTFQSTHTERQVRQIGRRFSFTNATDNPPPQSVAKRGVCCLHLLLGHPPCLAIVLFLPRCCVLILDL